MKYLYLVRHAKSSWDDLTIQDAERPLSERGMRDAPRMAKRIKEKEVTIDQMMTSHAVRALATCRNFSTVLKYPEENIRINRSLYHASEDGMLEVVHNFDDALDSVMVFAHNPGLTDFVNSLTNERITNVPTTGIVAIAFDVDSWKDITWGSGEMVFFDYPKSRVR